VDTPSVFTPFSRRFTNERDREIDETRQLYAWVRANHIAPAEFKFMVERRVYAHYADVSKHLGNSISDLIYDLLSLEPYLADLAVPDIPRMSLQEFVAFRDLLHQKQYFIVNQHRIADLLVDCLLRLARRLLDDIPPLFDPSPFTVPLMYVFKEPRALMQDCLAVFNDDQLTNAALFKPIFNSLFFNMCRINGKDPMNERDTKPYKLASGSSLPMDEAAHAYLGGTPFYKIFKHPVPLKLTQEIRFSHTHIIGGTGAGKTTLIENLILHDIASDDPPSIVLIDPHSDLVRKLFRADLGIEDRVILIDPRDIHHPPAINPFALNRARLDSYDDTTREQVTAGVIQTFSYLFGSLFNLDLTGKQSVFFRYCVRLLLSLPDTLGRNATILDMLHLMADDTPYRAAISKLPDIQRDFFERDFKSATFKPTKEQIRYRLQAIIENPTMARLFTAPETKLDLFSEMNRGAIILVDTAKDFLKDNSAVYGQLIISLVLQAVIERAAIAEHERKATFLYVDEAASFFSSNIDDLLTEARKFKTGLVLAHQYGDQASASLRASLAANTNIKMASGLSASDARMMAPDMRTTPDFILSQPRLQFATHIRNVTPSAVSIPIAPKGPLPSLSDAAFADLCARNRARVSLGIMGTQANTKQHSEQASDPDADGDADISSNW
jgi:Helicase HerA, central domain